MHLHANIPAGDAPAPQGARFTRLADALALAWEHYDAHICLCATGIVVRAIAPLLASKRTDPAVVVLDQDGRFAISLLSGHLGGANALARQLAAITGGQAVITTASDSAGLPALDVLLAERGLEPNPSSSLTPAMAALVRGEQLGIVDPLGQFAVQAPCFQSIAAAAAPSWPGPVLWVHWAMTPPSRPDAVIVHPKVLALGMGCRRGVTSGALQAFAVDVLERHGLAAASLFGMASIDLKADETGLLDTAAALRLPTTFFSQETLDAVDAPTPSAMVAKHVGTSSVAEAAALCLAAQGGHAASLLVTKHKGPGMTCAIALRQGPQAST